MRKIKLGLALVAALVFSVAAMTASASASSFLSSVTGAALLSEKVENQVFTTEEGTVECTVAKIVKGVTGTAGAEEASQLAEIKYEKCLAFGFVPTTLTNAHYTFLASGKADLNNLVKIVSSNGLGGTCEVSVKAKQNLGTIKYSTVGNNIKIEPTVTGITYTAGSECPKPGTFTTGSYKGNSEAMISGGSLSFMP